MSGRPLHATPFMPSEALKFVLSDIRDNILYARAFVEGIAFDRFTEQRLHFYAVMRALEIISADF